MGKGKGGVGDGGGGTFSIDFGMSLCERNREMVKQVDKLVNDDLNLFEKT